MGPHPATLSMQGLYKFAVNKGEGGFYQWISDKSTDFFFHGQSRQLSVGE